MFFLLFLPFSLACQPSNDGNNQNGGTNPNDQLLSIEMRLDIASPAAWTYPSYGDKVDSPQSKNRGAVRNKITADVTKTVCFISKKKQHLQTNLILTAHNYPTTQVVCTPTIENYVQGKLVRGKCSGDGQLLMVKGGFGRDSQTQKSVLLISKLREEISLF